MKRSIVASLALAFSLTSFAQLSGDGYYRLQNYKTGRYAYIVNNYGKINVSTTSADMTSIQLWKGEDKALADPATMVYIQNAYGDKYDLKGQGTGMHDFIGYYMGIKDNSSKEANTYMAYAEANGSVLYISDGEQSSSQDGELVTNGKNEYRYWYIKPVDVDDSSYLGINPDIEVDGKYYKSYYVGFPFTIKSDGVKAFYITKIEDNTAIYKEIESGKVPQAAPIFLECTSNEAGKNRITPTTDNTAALSDNISTGVYFNYYSKKAEKLNQVTYDAATMRVLGKTSDGSLGLITATDLTTIPMNTFYVTVPEGTAAELKLVSEASTGIETVAADNTAAPFDIYSINGTVVKRNATSTDGLPVGTYIANGQKIIVLP